MPGSFFTLKEPIPYFGALSGVCPSYAALGIPALIAGRGKKEDSVKE